MPHLVIAEVSDPDSLSHAFAIRRRVFVHEQAVSEALEFDAHDRSASHLLARRDDEAVGTLRIRFMGGGRIAKIERVAVLPEARGLAIGRRLILEALARATRAGAASALLHAQTQAEPFYRRLGFETRGAPFIEDGIPHVTMTRTLAEEPLEP